MSIDDRQLSGYSSYFTESMLVNLSREYSLLLHVYPAWALRCFLYDVSSELELQFIPNLVNQLLANVTNYDMRSTL